MMFSYSPLIILASGRECAAGGMLRYPGAGGGMATIEDTTRADAARAFANFKAGLGGDAEAMRRFITDDWHDEGILYFPKGPNLGGAYRKDQLAEFFGYVTKVYNSGLFITLDRMFVEGDTAGFQFHDEAVTRNGDEYKGCVFISLQMKDGKVWRYREYFGLRWNDDPPYP
jgi:ketosteroid isomerase-like protein